jgi:hypothetical protein
MPEASSSTDPAEARAQHRFEVLRELTDIGMELARDLRRQTAEPRGPDAPPVDFALTFARISRAVRQTLALEERFEAERRARHEKVEAERGVEASLRGMKRKEKVGEIVERVLDEHSYPERLNDSLWERLADADDTDFADRPVGEIVAAICKDLGVTVDWSLWEDEPWAAEALAAETAPAPFLSRAAGEGDRSPQSEGWRGQAPSTNLNSS